MLYWLWVCRQGWGFKWFITGYLKTRQTSKAAQASCRLDWLTCGAYLAVTQQALVNQVQDRKLLTCNPCMVAKELLHWGGVAWCDPCLAARKLCACWTCNRQSNLASEVQTMYADVDDVCVSLLCTKCLLSPGRGCTCVCALACFQSHALYHHKPISAAAAVAGAVAAVSAAGAAA